MVRVKAEISGFSESVNRAIRAEAGIRFQSQRDLGRIVGRSAAYVNARLHDETDWTITDLGRLCEAWGITPEELLRRSRQRR